MPLNLNNENVAMLTRLALDSYVGDTHAEALAIATRSIVGACNVPHLENNATELGVLARLADRHYSHQTETLGASHDGAMSTIAVIVAMACNAGKITDMLQVPRQRR